VLNILKECLIAIWSDFLQIITLQLTSAESVSRHVMQMVDILNTFCAQTLANICIFMFLVQLASIHRISFLLC